MIPDETSLIGFWTPLTGSQTPLTDRRMDEWMDKRMDKRMDERMDEQMDEQMDKRTENLPILKDFVIYWDQKLYKAGQGYRWPYDTSWRLV